MARGLVAVLVVLGCVAVSVQGFNITKVLEPYPDFSLFNQWLSLTGVVNEVNNRTSITLLATSNDALQSFLSGVPNAGAKPELVADTLRYQILLTYFGIPELRKIKVNNFTSVTTLLQTTGRVSGSAGFVDVYNAGSKFLVGNFIPNSISNETILGNVTQLPFDYSILQISSILAPPPTLTYAPSPAPGVSNSSIAAGPQLDTKSGGSYGNALSVSKHLAVMAIFLASMAPLL